MKVLLINGSPKKKGNTYIALDEVRKTLEAEGIATEMVHVGHKNIRGCISCYKCGELKKCVFDDDVNEIAEKFRMADGLVIGSPVYYASPNGTLLAFLDRLFLSAKFDKTMKVGAAVTVARRGGMSSTFDVLNKYFTICGMPVASSQYWNMVYGRTPGEAALDAEGLQTMRRLGKNMAFLIKSIRLGKEHFGNPVFEEETQMTNFIK
ncbi:MAG: flavodoxin family protein [Bacteroidales bacterium]|nr:flavodoxin family protein [Bacteroidales bacterium]MCM1147655.1 flavodoxin family protein [Bacteroidales bacterium]MCM1206817.1 flavodoxin family protein [Bacillota bacterium]MCM1510717.1 flavodoxin family protein [Clostridium sp.]